MERITGIKNMVFMKLASTKKLDATDANSVEKPLAKGKILIAGIFIGMILIATRC